MKFYQCTSGLAAFLFPFIKKKSNKFDLVPSVTIDRKFTLSSILGDSHSLCDYAGHRRTMQSRKCDHKFLVFSPSWSFLINSLLHSNISGSIPLI